jgi:hypothetical protein
MLKVSEDSLEWALKHVLRYHDTDVLPFPFEFAAIEHDWASIKGFLQEANVLDWAVRPNRALLAPKVKYGFRIVTQLDPLDFLVFAALVYEISDDIEFQRVPVGRGIVYSYRVDKEDDGQLFNGDIGYEDFRRRAREMLEDEKYSHVAIADIEDFYPRIYLHRLENAMMAATARSNHVRAIMHLLSGWNGTESFGIPVGNQPSRLLAEAVLIDVDEAMLAAGVEFVRFNDDYRILAGSHGEAYRRLASLADVLYRNHGLTLQPQKTTVVSRNEYITRSQESPEERELDSLYTRFQQLIDDLGLSDWYEEIDYADLTDAQQALVDSLNLQELIREELLKESPDFAVIRFVLRRLGQLGDASLADEILDHIEEIYPVFPDIIKYLSNLRDLDGDEFARIGGRVLDSLQHSILSELEYHQMWGMDLFAASTRWNHSDRFFRMLGAAQNPVIRRKLILAMGRTHQRHWFQTQWRNLFNESPWPRRAFIAAASCLPVDARKHWYSSIAGRLDPLEAAVMKWARANPF